MKKRKTIVAPLLAKPDVAATKIETVTQAPTPPPDTPKQSFFGGDPMWNARRVRIDGVLMACFGLCGISLYLGTAMANIVITPALTAMVATLGLYMGVAETGRVMGVLGTSTTTATSTAVSTKKD